MMNARILVDKLYDEVIDKLEGHLSVTEEEEYDKWWAGQELTDEDICNMYSLYLNTIHGEV